MATYPTGLSRQWTASLLLLCVGLLVGPATTRADDPPGAAQASPDGLRGEPLDVVMYHDPQLKVAEVKLTFPPGLKELWLKALARPDSELRRLAADSFVLGDQRGLSDLGDVVAPLAEVLESPGQSLVVRRAAVRALIRLDARQHAPLLAETARAEGLAIAQLVEPALARWQSEIMRQEWLLRLEDPRAGRVARVLAIDGLGAVGETAAAGKLAELVSQPRSSPAERISAARALARLQPPELVALAGSLAATPSVPATLNRALAVELLQQATDPAAIDLLKQLATSQHPSVQAGALRRLFAIDPRHVYPFAEAAITSRDAGVRKIGAEALVVQKELRWIPPLAQLLDDVNPSLRRSIARAFVDLAAESSLREAILAESTAMLQTDRWRGLEQAAIVLGLLDHEPVGERLVELMQHPRPEVMVASAWGLRKLALPELLPAMLVQAQATYDKFLEGILPIDVPGMEGQTVQLFMAFGQMRYHEAQPLLMHYVPKDPLQGTQSRAAAIWSLGLLNEQQAPPELSAQLLDRLADIFSLEPEAEDVRRMSAISLGRMKSTSAVPKMRRIMQSDGGYPLRASFWALEQLTGEAPPPPGHYHLIFSDWFLVPAD